MGWGIQISVDVAISWLAREALYARKRAERLEALLARLCATLTPHGSPTEAACGTLVTVEAMMREAKEGTGG